MVNQMNIEIGIFEAKTKLSHILQEVKRGKHFTITVRGVPVADLVPSEYASCQNTESAIESMREITKVKGVSSQTLIDWVGEGRK